jgi:hypothetical protein
MAIAEQFAIRSTKNSPSLQPCRPPFTGRQRCPPGDCSRAANRRRRVAAAGPHLRRLRHRPQEDRHRIAFRSSHLRPRNLRRGRGGWRRSPPIRPGDRVVVFHHIPCRQCYYCLHQTFAQCATYKKVGCTAGFEPSGGGFAEYVRVMDWIVEHGTVRIPEGVSFEQACFVEPVNTCMKGIEALRLQPGETVLTIGQGPIGIILSVLARRAGASVITSDLYPERLKIGKALD